MKLTPKSDFLDPMGGNKAISLEGGLSSSDEICLSLDEVNSRHVGQMVLSYNLTNKRT